MSYDLTIYTSTETPLQKSELIEGLRQRGWRTVLLHDEAFWNNAVQPFLPGSGPIEHLDITLLGWLPQDELASQLEGFVQDRNFEEFKALLESIKTLGACSLAITTPYDAKANFSENGWKEFQDTYPDNAVALSNARSCYYLHDGGGQSPAGLEFQRAAWQVITEITNGYAEDSQQDIFNEEHPR